VIEHISAQLGAELVTQRGPLARESLALQMLETSSQPDRLAWLAQAVPSLELRRDLRAHNRRHHAGLPRTQMELENSHQQFRNVWGAFAIEGPLPAWEPVLLVDDLADADGRSPSSPLRCSTPAAAPSPPSSSRSP
jgi:hypothetical protein